jgi:hypothetical protein
VLLVCCVIALVGASSCSLWSGLNTLQIDGEPCVNDADCLDAVYTCREGVCRRTPESAQDGEGEGEGV